MFDGGTTARGLRLLAAAATALTLAPVLLTPASATAGEEARFVALANGARSGRGLATYAVAYDLVTIARRHSERMAAAHTIFHNNRLATEVPNWQSVGENVGVGDDVDQLHEALMNSASHRANILDRDFTQLGVGVAHDERGRLYVTQVFRQPLAVAPLPHPPAPRRVRPPPPRRTPPPPAAPPALERKLLHARAIVARRAPRAAVDHALTYVTVMVALL